MIAHMSSDTITALTLLVGSNLFMTFAWYGHLRFGKMSILSAVFVSWGIAFFEYCLQVPANRIGYRTLSAFQLKIAQEAITLCVFMFFAVLILKEAPTYRHLLSFGLIFAAVAVAFYNPGR